MAEAILDAELLDDAGRVVAHVNGSLWKREAEGRLVSWGGDLRPANGLLPIDTGAYVLRLGSGKQGRILVNNIRVTGKAGAGPVSAATFLGNGSPPS